MLSSLLSLSLLFQPAESVPSDDSSGSDASPATVEFDRAEGFEKGPQEIKDKRTFELTDSYTIGPVESDVDQIRAWLEVPLETSQQTVENVSVDAGDLSYKITEDPVLGNRFLYIEIDDPENRTYEVVVNSRVTRSSISGPYKEELSDQQRQKFLRQTSEVPVNETMKELAVKQGAKGSDLASMRAIYNFVVNNSTYYKANPEKFSGSGEGDIDAEYCLYQKQGGCTDFHALYMSMGRSMEIPTRFVIGSFLPAEFEGKDKGVAYHCWAEAYLDGKGWLPLDAAYGDLWPDLHDYYFGQLDARRVAFSRGRGLTLVPESNQPVSYFIKGHVEADGEKYDNWTRKLTFEEVK
jgi:transglutaminase-like putative cysteine protease